jgi:flagellar protein FliT
MSDITSAEQVIALYERVSEITGRMVEAARAGDWARVDGLQEAGRLLSREMVKKNVVVPTPPELRDRKLALIREVLADDAEIRELADPRLARVLDGRFDFTEAGGAAPRRKPAAPG